LIAALSLLGASQARADRVDFSYRWGISPGAVLTGGKGRVSLALAHPGTGTATLGAADSAVTPAATVTTSSSATALNPDHFSTTYSLTVHLTDTASGASGDLTYSGATTGTLTATTSSLTNVFATPLTQQLTLGKYVYSLTIDPSPADLPSPGAQATTLLDALVTVTPGSQTHGTPEPSSLLLAAVAASLLGLADRRRRRRRGPFLSIP
jgi:hypothetical protein